MQNVRVQVEQCSPLSTKRAEFEGRTKLRGAWRTAAGNSVHDR